MKEINEIKEKNYNDDNIKIESFEIINKKEIEEDEEERKKEKEKTSSMRINKRKLNMIFYSGFILSLIYILLSLFIYSYLNLIHIFLSFYFILSFLNVYSKQLYFLSKKITHTIFLIQFGYIFLKGLLLLIYKLFPKEKKKDEPMEISWYEIILTMFNIKSDNWNFTLFEMGISLFELLLLLLYNILNDFTNKSFMKLSKKCYQIIQSWKGNENFLLNIGLYLICIGAIINPTIIHTLFLSIILIHLSSLLFNLKFNHYIRKKIVIFFKYFIPIYFIENYIFNCPFFKELIDNLINDKVNTLLEYLGVIFLYKKKENAYFYLKDYEIIHILPFIFFYFGYFCLIFFLALNKNKNDNENDFENINESIEVSLGIIKFYIESQHLNLKNKIKLYIIKYCITPEFFLHLCRIGIIIWINLYDTYFNVFFIIWILLSININNKFLFLTITKFTIFPLLIIVFTINYIYNIGFFSFKSNIYVQLLGLVKYTKESFELCFHLGLKITIITFFQVYIFIQMKYLKYYELYKNDIEKKRKIFEEKEINTLLNEIFKGNYILEEIEIIFKFVSVINSILVTVFFYLSICQSINIFNEIILMFIFSLFLFAKNIDEYYFIFLFSINISFILKYIVHLIYPKIQKNENTTNIYNLLSLLFFDNIQNIHYYWIAFYFLFIEYCNSTSIIFQKCKSKVFSIFQLIEQNEKLGNTIKFILITLCDFIFGIYIWLIILFFIIYFSRVENNILFLFNLFIIFIIYYKYIKISSNKYQNNENIFFYVWLLILSSIINFVLIYIIQFLNKRPLSFYNVYYNDKSKVYLEIFGLFLFEENYSINLFPYMIMFIISLALYSEIDRQLKLNNKSSLNDSKFSDGSEDIHKTSLLAEEKLKIYSTQIYYCLYYILHYYWIIIFLVVTILSIYWMLSLSMFIEIFIFSFYLLKSFKNYYSNITDLKFENDQMKLYNLQKKNHFRTTHSLQEEYFNLVWKFNLFFISLTYLSSIIFRYMEKEKETESLKFLKAIIYIIGCYSSRKNAENESTFLSYSFGYLLIIGLFSIRAYFLSKFEEIKVKIELAEEKKKLVKAKEKRNESFDEQNYILSLDTPDDSLPYLFPIESEYTSNNISINDNTFVEIENKINDDSEDLKSKDYSSINYIKKKMIKYSISFHKEIKDCLEVIIISIILISAILKVNIISFILLLFIIYAYKTNGLNTKIMFYLSSLVLILFNIQYLIFLSNFSLKTIPNYSIDEKIFEKINEFLPWYSYTLGVKWGFFFSCGVFQYQIRTLWIDVIILIFLYFYLEFFSFSLYEKQNEKNEFKLLFEKYSIKFGNFLNKEKYEKFVYNMKLSYDINLRFFDKKKTEKEMVNYNENEEKKKAKEKAKKNKKIRKFKKVRNFFFLVFHHFVLLIILILSSQNKGIISLGYIIFCIYYIYNICYFLSGKKWGLKNGIRGFLQPYIFFDLMLFFIFQIPLDFFKRNEEIVEEFKNVLGYKKILDFDSKKIFFDKTVFISLLMKIAIYFLILLEEKIYSSFDFIKFILKYHFQYMNQAYIIGNLTSILFNNHRIKLMNDKLKENEKLEETLNSLKIFIENWNKERNEFELNLKKKNEISIGKIIKKHWLVNLALKIHYSSRKINYNRINNKEDILLILQGNDYTYSELLNEINKFEEENKDLFDLNSSNKNLLKDEERKETNEDKSENNTLINKKTFQDEENKINKILGEKINKENDIFFPTAEYYEKKHKIRSLFFKKYFSKGKIFIYIIKSINKYLIENFEYVCYFFMIINNFAYGSLISIIWTIIVFSFGIIQYPRPSKNFWKFCIFLCSFTIVFKFTIQLNFIQFFLSENSIINLSHLFNKVDNSFLRLQIKRFKEDEYFEFIYYLIFDFLLFGILLMNQFILIKKGLYIDNNYETIEEANKRIIYYKSENGIKEFNDKSISSIKSILSKTSNNKPLNIIQKLSNYYENNFNYIRNEKPGKDFYTFYTIFQILIILYIIVFYTDMEQDNLISHEGDIYIKQFSKNMIFFLLIHLFICGIDRYIYMKNSRRVKKIKYKIYNKKTGFDETNNIYNEINMKSYENIKNYIKENKEKYSLVTYQYEGFQYSIFCKFILQMITVIFIHIFIFYYLPLNQNSKTNKNVTNDLSNNYVLVFYILYNFYFFFLCLQIKFGLAGMRKLSPLMSGSSMFYNIIYRTFQYIPFLFELKNFIDWSFTKTSLEIWQWLKFEEINSLLFINKCFNKSYMGRRIGSKRSIFLKIFEGWSLFIIVLLIMFCPLILFSNLNPSSQMNYITGTYFKVQFYYNNSFQNGNLTLLESSNSEFSEVKIDQLRTDYNDTDLINYLNANFQIQNISINAYGDFNWDINNKTYNFLYDNIEKENFHFYLRLIYSFTKKYGKSDESLFRYEDYNLTKENMKKFFDKNSLNNNSIILEKSFSKILRIPSEERPLEIINDKQDIILTYNTTNKKYKYWNIKSINQNNINIITFTDEFSELTFGYNILTFYFTFIILVGNYLRSMFLGSAERIMYTEMVLPNKLLSLCEGIRIARIKKDYLQEEQLYYVLIDLMRSPEMIKNITKSSLIFIQDKNILQKEEKQKYVKNQPILEDFNAVVRKSFQK